MTTSIKEALERIIQIYDRNIGRQNEKLADIKMIAHSALAQLDSADARSAGLTVGNVYESRIGPVVYLGLDHYCGETTHKFEVPGNPRKHYERPANLHQFLSTGLLPDASPGNGAEKVREALAAAHGKFCKIADTEIWTDGSCIEGWRRSPGGLREYAETAAKEIDAALHSTSAAGETTSSDEGECACGKFNDGNKCPDKSGRPLCAHALADALWNKQARESLATSLVADEAAIRADERERCARIADDHTPRKHEATLAAHVTGARIASAIRTGDQK